jgi:hypothetical protein
MFYAGCVSFTITDTKAQLKKLEEEKSALQLQLHQERQRAQHVSRHVGVVVQEKRSLELTCMHIQVFP